MASNSGKTIKTTDLRGLFIYQEKKRTVYYDIFNKSGYILNNAEIKNYDRPEKQKYVDYVAENESLTRMGLILLATVLLVAVLIYNIMTGVYKDQLSVIISYLVIAGAAVFFVLNVIAVFKKLKMEKK